MCNVNSHLAIKKNYKSNLITLEDRLQDFDIILENPNFTSPNADIDIKHVTDKTINAKLKTMLKQYNNVFSTSKFDVGHCNLINTKIPLSSPTVKHWEPERNLSRLIN